MKCPKCHYLGFETGDRCKNCGYDFSLLSVAELDSADYEIHPTAVDDVPIRLVEHIVPEDDPWIGKVEATADDPPVNEPRMELATQFVKRDVTSEPVVDLPLTPPAASEAPPAVQAFADTPVEISAVHRPIAPFLSAMPVRPPVPSGDRVLPLFKRAQEDDEPLIKMPAAPRPPLAVRKKTPRDESRGALICVGKSRSLSLAPNPGRGAVDRPGRSPC